MGGHHRTGVALFLTTAVTIYDRPTARVGRPEGRPARPASPTWFSFLQGRYNTTHFGFSKDLRVSVVSARVAMPSLSAEEERELQRAVSEHGRDWGAVAAARDWHGRGADVLRMSVTLPLVEAAAMPLALHAA